MSPLHYPTATVSKGTPEQEIAKSIGASGATPYDPAFAPRQDRLLGLDPRAVASTIRRDIPITTVNTNWDVAAVRCAMQSMVIGLFDQPAQLVDSIVGDSRVQAAMVQGYGSLLSCPLRFRLPKRWQGDPIAKKALKAWERTWAVIGSEPVLVDMLQWGDHLGFWTGQISWDTTSQNIWRPYLQPWNPRYTYYNWLYRCYVAIGMDGQYPVFGGDGNWILHAPYGEYRGWIRGAMRAVAPWWLARSYALRDWARYSERNGMPWVKGKTPAAGDKSYVAEFRASLSLLGQETAITVPQGVDQSYSYDVELMESNITGASDGFEKLINRCSDEIIMALMGNNLTTEVTGGSLAAAKAHQGASTMSTRAKGRALANTLTTQIIRPFTAFNFGDPSFACIAEWDTSPPEDQESKARSFAAFTKGLSDLATAGYKLTNAERVAKSIGLKVVLEDAPEPTPELASKTGHAEPDSDEAPAKSGEMGTPPPKTAPPGEAS